jgi:hypothetical protein
LWSTARGDRRRQRGFADVSPTGRNTHRRERNDRRFAWLATGVVAFIAVREPPQTHDQLISLQGLRLDDHAIEFGQAFVSLTTRDGVPSWSCTLRGISADELSRLEGELALSAHALDGRTLEGRVEAPSSLPPSDEAPTVVELAGLGTLLIDGRKP